MAFFKVCFDVAPVEMYFDGAATNCGFVKNVYVWATSESAAIAAARSQLDAALSKKSRRAKIEFSDAAFKVESVEPSSQFWKLVRPEGFVFYKQEGAERANR